MTDTTTEMHTLMIDQIIISENLAIKNFALILARPRHMISSYMVSSHEQEAQLSQRGHATLHVIGNYAKSFKVTPLSSMFTSSYEYSIVTMSLSCTVSEIFNIESWHALETVGVRGHSGSPFDRLYTTSYQSAIVIIALDRESNATKLLQRDRTKLCH